MTSSWVALDASTNPAARARDLRLARERFLQDPATVDGVRAPIVASWRRSAALGLDPARRAAPVELTEEEARAPLAAHPLGPVTPLLEGALWPGPSGSGRVAAGRE